MRGQARNPDGVGVHGHLSGRRSASPNRPVVGLADSSQLRPDELVGNSADSFELIDDTEGADAAMDIGCIRIPLDEIQGEIRIPQDKILGEIEIGSQLPLTGEVFESPGVSADEPQPTCGVKVSFSPDIEETEQHRPIEEVFLELLEFKERHLSPSQSNTDKLRDIYIEIRKHPLRHRIEPPELLAAIEKLAL